MAVPREVIQQIKERIQLSSLIGEYVRLTRDGGGDRSKGLCPFHNERTPSFSVSDDRGFYYCFGCQASGDAIKFLTEHTGVTFMEAVESLAVRAGVELPKYEAADPEEDQRRRRGQEAYYRVMSASNAFFRAQLQTEAGQDARAYLQQRGIDAETIDRFQLGYAPAGWRNLTDAMCTQGIPPAHIARAGLARTRKDQDFRKQESLYDAFRDRVMFPILALNGKPIAFSGRALAADDPAKYINSPETRFYVKGENLYGLHAARRAMRQREQVVLVEGNFDVVSLHAAGIEETVAPLGTALTARQAEQLGRFCSRVILAFDGDHAGKKASLRAFEVLLEAGIHDVRWLMFEADEDPDSFVRARGGELLRERVDNAPMMLEMVLENALAETTINPDPTVRRHAMSEVATWLARVSDPYVAQMWREEMARRLMIPVESIRREEVAAKSKSRRWDEPVGDERQDVEIVKLTHHEQALVLSIDAQPQRLDRVARQQLYRVMLTPRFGNALEFLARSWSEGANNWNVLIEELPDRSVASAIRAVLAGDAIQVSTGDEEFETLLLEFQQRWVRARATEIEAKVSEAARNNPDDVPKLLEELERLFGYLNG